MTDFILGASKSTADGDCNHEIKRHLLLGRKAMINLDSILKSRDIANKSPSCTIYGFSSSHVWMWESDHKESLALKNWCFWTVVLEKTLESLLDCKEIIKSVNLKGYQSWIFIGRTVIEAEAPILWPLDAKNWLIWKDPDSGKDWRQEEKGMTEDKMVGGHHQLDGHEFEQTPGIGDGQESLVCCSPWSLKESDMTEQLNWTEGLVAEPWGGTVGWSFNESSKLSGQKSGLGLFSWAGLVVGLGGKYCPNSHYQGEGQKNAHLVKI